ncbi:hypothetical protein NG895_01500 [Aeoliella sp. ICT_H6.2]|uniref:PEP-CTERM protein-sorting domain-containing protein n=1 Tax=Aeoliella straminimaris TaxID=2954799 RepID=A0A9X2F5E1_9BACT|nr:hypothetical protein [Aeoliella straminimaris]MCO6042572.1 hypothetical protein [Aeoliella straminimaris]
MPPMPGMTNGDGNPANNGMKHILVSLDGTDLAVHVAEPPATPVTMMSGMGHDYAMSFEVLENHYFNAQYGWLQELPIVPPAASDVWIKRTGATMPGGATFRVFEGGMGMDMGSWTMNQIHTEAAEAWKWDRDMQHDLYVADLPGEYSMSFEVYLGDATTGEPLAGYGSATTTLYFTTPVPEPSCAALAGVAVLAVVGCRWRKSRG